MSEEEMLQHMFMKCTGFKPLLTPEQYTVYVEHIKESFALGGKLE